jgi:hypothetical protein
MAQEKGIGMAQMNPDAELAKGCGGRSNPAADPVGENGTALAANVEAESMMKPLRVQSVDNEATVRS